MGVAIFMRFYVSCRMVCVTRSQLGNEGKGLLETYFCAGGGGVMSEAGLLSDEAKTSRYVLR